MFFAIFSKNFTKLQDVKKVTEIGEESDTQLFPRKRVQVVHPGFARLQEALPLHVVCDLHAGGAAAAAPNTPKWV